MTTSGRTICYIDDHDSNLLLIRKTLSYEYQVTTIDSPVGAVEKLVENQPDLILLDVNMPDVDGYELCRNIRNHPPLEQIPVVFLTARNSLEDRLLGFDAGGDAYVTKPFEFDELKRVLLAILNRYEQIKTAQSNAESSNQMVWTLMKNNSEFGLLIQYARSVSKVRDMSSLMEITLECLSSFGLQCAIAIRTPKGDVIARTDNRPNTDLELELFELSRNSQRILNIGNKYIFNGAHCAFLIKNMPIDDDDLTGRLRDHLAILLESCDACVELVNFRTKEMQSQKEATGRTQSTIDREFESVMEVFETQNNLARENFETLSANLEESFLYLGLTEEQEEQLLKLVDSSRKDMEQFEEVGHALHQAMDRIADSLAYLGKTQH